MINTKMIGKKITEARKKLNISQAHLAEQLFISAQAVGKWERGESMPDIVTFSRLAEILNVDLNYFLEENMNSISEKLIPQSRENEKMEIKSLEPTNKLNWDMSKGNWVDADFSGLKNLFEKFSSSNMQRCKFNDSDLSGILLKNNNVEQCDFTGSDISKSQIQTSHLTRNIFRNCSLKGTEFIESFLYDCDFTGTDFTEVVIKSGGISGVVMKRGEIDKNKIMDAVWKHTSFIGSYLSDFIFTGKMEDCYFENCAFTRVYFLNVTITNSFFKNRSLKRIKFINCQADKLTYAFLKNGKADLKGIRLLD